MNWLYVIIAVALIGAVLGWVSAEKGQSRAKFALGGLLAGASGAAFLMAQLFLVFLGFYVFFKIGAWLFDF